MYIQTLCLLLDLIVAFYFIEFQKYFTHTHRLPCLGKFQKPTRFVIRPGCGESWEPGTQPTSPTWVPQVQLLCHPAPPRVCISGKLVLRQRWDLLPVTLMCRTWSSKAVVLSLCPTVLLQEGASGLILVKSSSA